MGKGGVWVVTKSYGRIRGLREEHFVRIVQSGVIALEGSKQGFEKELILETHFLNWI